MSKKIEELKEQLKRERFDSLSADKQWQAKVTELQAEISRLQLLLDIHESDINFINHNG